MAKVSKVFISYRRDDASDLAGRIRDRMIQNWRLSKENVFMDIETIQVGADFVQVIERTIRECQAMVILISPSWLTQVNTPGVSYVRLEAELAIRYKLKLIPILAGGAKLPSADQLPESLRSLTSLNIRPVRPDAFDFDLDAVRRSLGVGRGLSAPAITAISALVLVALGAATLSQMPPGNPIYALAHAQTAPTATPRTLAHATLAIRTANASTLTSPTGNATVTANCGDAGTRIGGGYTLTHLGGPIPQGNPPFTTANFPSGNDGWTVSADAPNSDVVAYAYCMSTNVRLTTSIAKQAAGIQPVCDPGGIAVNGGDDNDPTLSSHPSTDPGITSWTTALPLGALKDVSVYSMCVLSGLSAAKVVKNSASGGSETLTAACDAKSQFLVGGGYDITAPNYGTVVPIASTPTQDFSAWQVKTYMDPGTADPGTLTVYAVCASIPQYVS